MVYLQQEKTTKAAQESVAAMIRRKVPAFSYRAGASWNVDKERGDGKQSQARGTSDTSDADCVPTRFTGNILDLRHCPLDYRQRFLLGRRVLDDLSRDYRSAAGGHLWLDRLADDPNRHTSKNDWALAWWWQR